MSEDSVAIHIHQLEALAHVGVTEDERAHPQRIVLNITAWPNEKIDSMRDDIGATVDYSAIAYEALRVISDRTDKLIETLANEVAGRLLEKFAIGKVAVEVQKFVLPNAEYVSVTAVRAAESA